VEANVRRKYRDAAVFAAVGLTAVVSQPLFGAAQDTRRPAIAAPADDRHSEVVDVKKLTVHVTPLVHLTRTDARGVVTVPKHRDNRVLRVILESQDYYTASDVELDGDNAPQSHTFYWRDLPPGSYRASVRVYGVNGLRDSAAIGTTELSAKN